MARPSRKRRQSASSGPLDSGLGVLLLAAFPLLMLLFQGRPETTFTGLLMLVIFALAVWLIHRGTQIARAFEAAETAKAPRLPRKMIGAALLGLLVMILAGHHFVSLPVPLGLGVLAFGLGVAAFGRDPLTSKRATVEEDMPHLRTQETLNRIDAAIGLAVADVAALNDAELSRRAEALRSGVMGLMQAISQDPLAARRLRKPVARFLELLSKENARLIEAWGTKDRMKARRRYLARLTSLGEAFEERLRKAGTEQGRDAYDVEADLLWNRMVDKNAA
ncbi:hypothetical protein [Salipiger sp. PrR002]|uniref:hypothetical protein n=1 Tax=Salipiger sp. PrR002 TaxID=2706489 RepID=UPI0013BE3D3F|nr:hypothetical protein [Salipiger sp. PrR002]NDW01608.1 hypothetical protein [Salipiger sp. PrR002]NDW58319.1 hypothetical protein [Salipiger sp. PrR004]